MHTVLDLEHAEAKKFFLDEKEYCTSGLPKYFSFKKLLNNVDDALDDDILKFINKKNLPSNSERVNYKLFHNKDSEYGWRMLQIIHPVFYVALVKVITDKGNWRTIKNFFGDTNKCCKQIECTSIPVANDKEKQILNWWENYENKSICLALDYKYLFQTDIVDCYGSIYTHTIPWALHGKDCAKRCRNNQSLLGNKIDKYLRWMSHGQTNGIPQGSTLMDFIAEILLTYIDKKLQCKLKEMADKEFKILRYRDDYRIFVNNPETGKDIVKELAFVLGECGMRLNSAKTFQSNDIVSDSIKEDKKYWLQNYFEHKNENKHLIALYEFAKKYPNSGTLVKQLQKFYEKIEKQEEIQTVDNLISIVTAILLKNPRTCDVSATILGKLLSLKTKEEAIILFGKIEKKFEGLPNNEMVQLWLQRIILKQKPNKIYTSSTLSKVIKNEKNMNDIWDSDWILEKKLKKIIAETDIIDRDHLEQMNDYPDSSEVGLFRSNYYV